MDIIFLGFILVEFRLVLFVSRLCFYMCSHLAPTIYPLNMFEVHQPLSVVL